MRAGGKQESPSLTSCSYRNGLASCFIHPHYGWLYGLIRFVGMDILERCERHREWALLRSKSFKQTFRSRGRSTSDVVEGEGGGVACRRFRLSCSFGRRSGYCCKSRRLSLFLRLRRGGGRGCLTPRGETEKIHIVDSLGGQAVSNRLGRSGMGPWQALGGSLMRRWRGWICCSLRRFGWVH
jgi:hypothetical protein